MAGAAREADLVSVRRFGVAGAFEAVLATDAAKALAVEHQLSCAAAGVGLAGADLGA